MHRLATAPHTPATRTLIAATLALAASCAQATVEPGHWSVSTSGNQVAINVHQTPDGDGTGTFLTRDARAGTLTYVTSNVDEGSLLFIVKPGDEVSLANLSGLTGFGSQAVKVGQDFYLGAATRSYTDPGFSYNTWTSFGWAHFQVNSQGALQIVDSAMAFREPGIIVGTLQTTVPEPGTWAIMALGLLALAGLRQTRTPLEGCTYGAR
ncbi:MAG: PEP-CTERM sorting domain-containing protein [Aquabacterium sp.]